MTYRLILATNRLMHFHHSLMCIDCYDTGVCSYGMSVMKGFSGQNCLDCLPSPVITHDHSLSQVTVHAHQLSWVTLGDH